jgi:hypothetical protein
LELVLKRRFRHLRRVGEYIPKLLELLLNEPVMF